jgi:hypothetical protein
LNPAHNGGSGVKSRDKGAVLEIPPVVSPETAVKVSIVADLKGKK